MFQRTRASSVANSAADPKNLKDLEHYYKALKKNVLDFQFEFIVSLKKSNKVRTLLVNLKDKSIQFIKMSKKQKHKKSKIKKYNIDDLERITKIKSDNKTIQLTRKNGKKDKTVTFISTERRECFYELLWLARDGITVLPDREEQTQFDNITMFVSTWNVGDAQPRADHLQHWIPRGPEYDLYVIGVQECQYDPVHLRDSANGNDDCEEHWFSMLANHIGTNYVRLESISLVKMRLIIFVRKEHYYKINHIEKDSEATGIGGVYGNKGATAISFQFLETSFCFISSHFAAHQEKSEQRNRNYRDIVKGLNLGNRASDCLNQFHHVIWMGDFNYRVDLFREEVLNLVKKNNIGKILAKDQLAAQKQAERVFLGFKESAIQFLPTYKMVRGTPGLYTEEKQRVPSWCDRILWKSLPYTQPIAPIQYSCAPDILTSDHIPVFGIFNVLVQRPCLPVPQSLIRPLKIYFYDLRAENLSSHDSHEDKDKDNININIKDKDSSSNNSVNSNSSNSSKSPPSPFLVFNACSYVEDPVATSVIRDSRNPLWGNISPIVPIIQKKSFLENQHLFITIVDESESKSNQKSNQKSSRKVLGHASIPLALGFNNEPYTFKTRITKYGLNAGLLYGKIHILYDNIASTPPLIPIQSDSNPHEVAHEVAYGQPTLFDHIPTTTTTNTAATTTVTTTSITFNDYPLPPPPPPPIITSDYYDINNNNDNDDYYNNNDTGIDYNTNYTTEEYDENINSIAIQIDSINTNDNTLSPTGSNRPILRRSKSFRKSI